MFLNNHKKIIKYVKKADFWAIWGSSRPKSERNRNNFSFTFVHFNLLSGHLTAYKKLLTPLEYFLKYFCRKKSLSMSNRRAFVPLGAFLDLKLKELNTFQLFLRINNYIYSYIYIPVHAIKKQYNFFLFIYFYFIFFFIAIFISMHAFKTLTKNCSRLPSLKCWLHFSQSVFLYSKTHPRRFKFALPDICQF